MGEPSEKQRERSRKEMGNVVNHAFTVAVRSDVADRLQEAQGLELSCFQRQMRCYEQTARQCKASLQITFQRQMRCYEKPMKP